MRRYIIGFVAAAAGAAAPVLAQFDDSPWPGFRGRASKWGSVQGAPGPATSASVIKKEFATVSPGGFTVSSAGDIYFKTHNHADFFPHMYVYRLGTDGGVKAQSADFGFVPGSFGSYAGVAVGVDAVYTTVYRGAGNTSVVKLNKNTLATIAEWTDAAFVGLRGTPLIGSVPNQNGNVNLYVHDRNGLLIHAVDSVTGQRKWSYPILYETPFGQVGPQWVTGDGRQAFAYFGNGDLGPGAAIADNGDGTYQVLWEFKGPQNFNWWGSGALSQDGNRIYVNTFNDGDTPTTWAISVANGSVVWAVPGKRDTPEELNFFGRPAVIGTRVYCAGGFGVVTAFDDLGADYSQAWEWRDNEGEYTSVSAVKTPGGKTFVYAAMQEDLATQNGKLLILEDKGNTVELVLKTDLNGQMRRTLFANNSACVDGQGNLWIAGGRHDDPTVGDIYIFKPGADECYPDCDGNNALNLFDFLCFVQAFNAGNNYADCDGNNALNLFDFLCFVGAFNAGC